MQLTDLRHASEDEFAPFAWKSGLREAEACLSFLIAMKWQHNLGLSVVYIKVIIRMMVPYWPKESEVLNSFTPSQLKAYHAHWTLYYPIVDYLLVRP